MKRKLITVFVILFTFSILFVPSLYAKNLIFQAEANTEQLRWTTFVKAYSTSNASDHTDPKILRDRTGGSAWYQTKYISFHLDNSAIYDDKENGELVYFDDSGTNVINSENYRNYTNLVHEGRKYLVNSNPAHSIKKEFYSTWSETERVGRQDYAVEESSHGEPPLNSNENWMRISTFRLSSLETDYVTSIIAEKYENKELEVQQIGDLLYAKVMLTNILAVDTNQNMANPWEFYYNSGKSWVEQNYGRSNGRWVPGQSALNNYDNYLLIPFKEKEKDRHVYVTYQVLGDDTDNGVFWNLLKAPGDAEGQYSNDKNRYQYLKDGTKLQSLGSSNFENKWWLEHYQLNKNQKNMNVTYEKSLENYGTMQYEYAGVRVITGGWDSINGDFSKLNGAEKSIEVANEDSSEPIKVIFYYRPKAKDNQYVYIKHVDSDTNQVISELKNSESFSPDFREKYLTYYSSIPSTYQSAYTFKADGSICGGIYNKNKVKSETDISINGITYTYKGYRAITSPSESTALNRVSSSQLITSEGAWLDPAKSTNYTTIIFYYKPKDSSQLTDTTIPDVKLEGRLDFINTDRYLNTTNKTFNGSNADIIPASINGSSDEWLSPYVDNAYPYIVRAMKYSTKSTPKNVTPKITLKKRYYHTETTTNAEGKTSVKIISGTSSKTYSYNVNITHKYFNIDNFKMYMINNLEVTDSNNSDGYGGNLFKDSNGTSKKYYINTSSDYQKRFNGGKVNQTFNIKFSNVTRTLSGSAYDRLEANSDIESVGKNGATNLVSLKINVEYDNQYIKLFGLKGINEDTDMLQQNLNTYVHTLSGDDTFTVDSTKGCNYTSNLISYMKPSNRTTYADFEIQKLKIAEVGDNGIRLLSGKVNYTLVGSTNDGKYNIGGNDFESANYTYEVNSTKKVKVTNSNLGKIDKTFNSSNNYSNNANAKKEVRQVNVLTPLRFNTDEKLLAGSYQNVVDMSLGEKKQIILQQGREFTIKPSMRTGHSSYSSVSYNADQFVDYYYVVCDFETNNNKPYHPYKVSNSGKISLIPTSVVNNNAVSNRQNNIYIIAVAKNAPPKIKSQVTYDFATESRTMSAVVNATNTYISNNENTAKAIGVQDTQSTNNWLTLKRFGAANHVIMRTINTGIINRIYDFEVTDCTDLAFKNVFRNDSSSNGKSVNQGTEKVYFSGTKYLLVESGETKVMQDRILGTPKTIIPLGPYKNTNQTYIFAPKLGYRFSFDLKTTGYLDKTTLDDKKEDNDRFVGIVPRYYYVSKDGVYKPNITLYYKDEIGKYRQLSKYIPTSEGTYSVSKGGNYNIYFKPNDGYRYLRGDSDNNFDLKYMSDKLKLINVSNNNVTSLNCNNANNNTKFPIKLTKEMMSLDKENEGFVQTWYGEFKLPNSTIAVNNDDSKSSINNPLNNGYIGVIFDIYCIDPTVGTVLYYGKDNKNSGTTENTSQWDYEGYLGFNSPGNSANLNLQLEKGNWKITNDIYKQIKGTVILYDIDARAANDFN